MDYGFLGRSILLQVIVFCLIPFIVWALRQRKNLSFFGYVGLTAPQKTGNNAAIALFAACYFAVYGAVHFVPAIRALTQPSAGAYAGMGAAALVPAVFVCFVQQAFAEEVLFRGFVGKRLIARLGFAGGNALQAAVFGGVHVLLSQSDDKNIVSYLIIFVSITAGGWLLGYVGEKLSGGSIVPNILLHGAGNYIPILLAAF